MKIDVYFTPLGLHAGDLAGRGVVVIDVLRATTTVIAALASGAKAVTTQRMPPVIIVDRCGVRKRG